MQNKKLSKTLHELCDIITGQLDKRAYTAVMIPIATEYLEKADILPSDKLIITAEEGKITIQPAAYFECDGDCDDCVAESFGCDGDCEECPCRFNCDDYDEEPEEYWND